MLDVGAVLPEDAVISWVTILVIPHHLGNIDGHADIYMAHSNYTADTETPPYSLTRVCTGQENGEWMWRWLTFECWRPLVSERIFDCGPGPN